MKIYTVISSFYFFSLKNIEVFFNKIENKFEKQKIIISLFKLIFFVLFVAHLNVFLY